MNYRKEIDGLRAFAVIPVLLFHAGITKGGFLGVDIFFVISGYLITGILITSLQTNSFSFSHFYERRARRILPVLLFITAVSIPFAMYYMSPSQLRNFGESLVAIPLFVSNILFCISSNYFAEFYKFLPLLHTWSIGVEEQFYILFPGVLYLIWSFNKKILLHVLVSLTIISLLYSAAMSQHHSTANYYLLPSRIWELMVGAILTILELKYARQQSTLLNKIVPMLGMLVLTICIVTFDATVKHPGFLTLIPIIAVAAIIWFSGTNDLATKFLSWRPMVGIGLISYSIYLWHLPLLTFLRFNNIGDLSLTAKMLFIPVTITLSYFSWLCIEKPFRNPNIISLKVLLTSVVTGSLIIIGFGLGFMYDQLTIKNPVPHNVNISMLRTSSFNNRCYFENENDNGEWFCHLGDRDVTTLDFAVIGDSLALDLSGPFKVAALKSRTTGILSFMTGCLPFAHENLEWKESTSCSKLSTQMYEYVKEHNIKNLIMISNWQALLERLDDDQRVLYKNDLSADIDRYNALGTTVYVMLQTAKQNKFPSEIYKAIYRQPRAIREAQLLKYSVTRAEQEQKQAEFLKICSSIKGKKFVILDYNDIFCNANICPVGTLWTSYYNDPAHLSRIGAMKYEPVLTEFLKNLK